MNKKISHSAAGAWCVSGKDRVMLLPAAAGEWIFIFFTFFQGIFVFPCCEPGRKRGLLECRFAEGECPSCMHEGQQSRNSNL